MSYISDIKKLKNNKHSDSRLRDICNALSDNYRMSSLLEIVMEYYMLSEMINESLSEELKNAGKELEVIHGAVKELADGRSIAGMADRLLEIRNITIQKMNCVTAYVDRFLVFEYILNRLGPEYEMTEYEMNKELEGYDETTYVKELLQYIFSSDDNMVVNERLGDVLECLPVRMARKKYLNMVEKGISLYEDSDRAAFDEYIYMLRTSAMLYEIDDPENLFADYERLFEEFKAVDPAELNRDYYMILSEKLGNVTVKLGDVSDVYMYIQKLVNMLYIYSLNEDLIMHGNAQEVENGELTGGKGQGNEIKDSRVYLPDGYEDIIEISRQILDRLYSLNMDEHGDINNMPEEDLSGLEGYMEQLYEARLILEPVNEDNQMLYENRLEALGLKDACDRLNISNRLFRSPFAALRAEDNEPLSRDYMESEASKLMKELEQLMSESNRYIARAVINNTFCKLPLPFRTADDVKDYITSALGHCGSKAELVAVKRSIDGMIY